MSDTVKVALIGFATSVIVELIRRQWRHKRPDAPSPSSVAVLALGIAITALVTVLFAVRTEVIFLPPRIDSSEMISFTLGSPQSRLVRFDFPVKHAWIEITDAPSHVGFINVRGITNNTVSLQCVAADGATGAFIYRVWATSY